MQKICLWAAAFLAAALPFAFAQGTQIVSEDFSSEPVARGWESFGDAQLIQWRSSTGDVAVTWDSSKPNQYLRLPLHTLMTRRDNFSIELDLLLTDFAAGVNAQKPGTFQLAFGFQNRADASDVSFLRAGQGTAPNLVDFNFMPDTGFGATVWPAVLSTNGAMNYSGASDFSIFELPLDVTMRIAFAYTASNETASITITTNGVLAGPVTSARLATNDVGFGTKFTQFHVDTFAIASYSDAGQNGPFAGSILAHGVIDNVRLEFPPAPIRNFRGGWEAGSWEVRFLSRTNWIYLLESTADFHDWGAIGEPKLGNDAELAIRDLSVGADDARFYRIQATPAP